MAELVLEDVQHKSLQGWRNRQLILLMAVDLSALIVVLLLWMPAAATGALVGLALLVITRRQMGLYRVRFHCSALDELPRSLAAAFLAAGLFGCLTLVPGADIRMQDVVALAAAGVALAVMRGPAYVLLRDLRRHDIARQRLLLVGSGVVAEAISEIAKGNADYGLDLVCEVPDLLDTDLVQEATRQDVSVVLVAFSRASEAQEVFEIRRGLEHGLQVMAVPRYFDLISESKTDDLIFGVPVQRLAGPRSSTGLHIKRLFDVVMASLGLLLVGPLLLLLALPLRRETHGDLLFRQERVGKDGRPFELLKLQTMRPVPETASDTAWTVTGDRIGPIGRFLRKSSLDELPQLWNILRGDMSLVGPRPERPHFVERFTEEFAHYEDRHRMTAGLTGLAQIYDLRGDTSIEDRARFDNRYADHWSLWCDLKIILKTVPKVIKGSGN